MTETFDVVVVGGGPSGATAAHDLALKGRSVLLLDKAGRIKPCGGAIPPRLIRDFDIPAHLLVARITSARMVAPSAHEVDMPIDVGGFVGMVDRDVFDEWLRDRAASAGVTRRSGSFETLSRDPDGTAVVEFRPKGAPEDAPAERVRARCVIGADGARSQVGKQAVPGADRVKCVFAYHEIIASPQVDAPGTMRSAATCTTRASSRRISTPGSSRMATPSASARVGTQGFLAPWFGHRTSQDDGSRSGTDHPARRRADPDEAAEALGQRARRAAGRRCRRRRRPGLRRRHLLRDDRRALRG
jgi:2-polyprenyl-6-methoxyphenol hydroxylase-like FAD-dependent oxidoreductase